MHVLGAAVLVASLATSVAAAGRTTIISNTELVHDTDGNVVQAHDGNIVYVNGTYFLYGEHFGEGPYLVQDPALGSEYLPRLVVYTSQDMATWEFRGFLHNNTSPGWNASGVWPWYPKATFWSAEAIYNPHTKRVVLWFSASKGACCDADFGVASSADGIHFDLHTLSGTIPEGAVVDGSSLFVDDDGEAYIAFTVIRAPGGIDHQTRLQRLTTDMLTLGEVVVDYFPDKFTEGATLFKRGGWYYLLWGSCCCACREGSGVSVYRTKNITGPWVLQSQDLNCHADAAICAGMGYPAYLNGSRPLGQLIVAAQGTSISVLPSHGDEPVYLWGGNRWLSGPNNPPKCMGMCTSRDTGSCQESPDYAPGHDYKYFVPLAFSDDGAVLPFGKFVDSFEMPIP